MKKRFTPLWRRSLFWALAFCTFSRCASDVQIHPYEGVPEDLRYIPLLPDYEIISGHAYFSDPPSWRGGSQMQFALLENQDEILHENISVDSNSGVISLNDFNRLLPGEYQIGVQMKHQQQGDWQVFPEAYAVRIGQGPVSGLKYSPSTYSIYADDVTDATAMPGVRGGGPYQFRFPDHYNGAYQINETTGVISLKVAEEVSPDFVEEELLTVIVSNALDTITISPAITMERIGADIGRMIFQANHKIADRAQNGLINTHSYTYTGDYTTVLKWEEEGQLKEMDYSTTLLGAEEAGNPLWHYCWFGRMKRDSNGEEIQLAMSKAKSKNEGLNYLFTDAINLSAYPGALTTYIKGTIFANAASWTTAEKYHSLRLLVCRASEFNAEQPDLSAWSIVEENIIPDLLLVNGYNDVAFPIDAELYEEYGTTYALPEAFQGQEIVLALQSVLMNPYDEAHDARPAIEKWEIRAKK
ncbi:hypothetical protein [Persicobacter diffluens]|uniref:Uncharacterized protein n=1 Tax=Persicobacter diffluens TaxID=981 RepID=A0AAN4VXK1_9BACT|nr:hypothetical protein PEDI_11670 [Persicobacter diffluens]